MIRSAVTAATLPAIPSDCEQRALIPDNVRQVFEKLYLLEDSDRNFLILSDLTREAHSDRITPYWQARPGQIAGLVDRLKEAFPDRTVRFVFFETTLRHGGAFPDHVWEVTGSLPTDIAPTLEAIQPHATRLDAAAFQRVLHQSQIVFAGTEYSITGYLQRATADTTRPRSLKQPLNPLKALSVIGANPALNPAIQRSTQLQDQLRSSMANLVAALSKAYEVEVQFEVEGAPRSKQSTTNPLYNFHVDVRDKQPLFEPQITSYGGVDNLPAGEAWLVPVDGFAVASETRGIVPVEIEGEIVVFKIEHNRAVEVLSHDPISQREQALLRAEPLNYNVAELGFGILGQLGYNFLPYANPSSTMNNEKLAFHFAFGLNSYWPRGGGNVGPDKLNDPQLARHQDYVYHRAMQPRIRVKNVVVKKMNGSSLTLIVDDVYRAEIFHPAQP